ncbi:undecaprenyl/decaprenyl-phosphate alpha-N-acetylglucosaminyl 1-phosphate transferase [Candidatus Nomurabacteria bacterium]|nr:undecaprenyl/decaprenyl-phosphate alpha-N-acetylglucosaminyl 1-phosphate transferase [Candidatus Nomurabacteria bacterium]
MFDGATKVLTTLYYNSTGLSWLPDAYHRYTKFIPIFLIAFAASFLLTPIVGYLARKYDVVNDTQKRSRNKLNRFENQNRRINPNQYALLGGLGVIIPLLVLLALFIHPGAVTIPFIIGILILTAGGIVDDIYNLPATTAFIIQFLAALIVAISVVNITLINLPIYGILTLDSFIWKAEFLKIPLEFVFPGDLLMILWIVATINAVKWISGVDALMESNLIVTFLLLFILAIRFEILLVAVVSIIMAGSISGFTIFNLPPAKIGSAGTRATYGFIVAVMSIVNEAKVATTILILLLPFADFCFVILKRLALQKPKTFKDFLLLPVNIMRTSDSNHIHHQLLKLDFNVRQIVLIEVTVTMFVGSLAILTTEAYKFFYVIFGVFIIGLGILSIHMVSTKKEAKKKFKSDKETPESKYSY